MLEVTNDVRRTAESWGSEGTAWLAALPGIVERLTNKWSLELGDVLEGGKGSLVARVRRDGGDAVLKIAPPGTQFARQVAAITSARGRGYVLLHEVVLEHNAALMEPLGATLAERATDVAQALEILSTTLLEAWKAPRPREAPSTYKATELTRDISTDWEALHRPCSQELKDKAIRYARERAEAFDLDSTVLCHGDPHPANLLEVLTPRPGAESGYVFVDPDGFVCDPAYDLGVVIRAWTDEVLAADDPEALLRGYCARLEEATGVPAEAIWQWGFVDRVSSGLFLLRCGHEREGRTFLESAERLR